jgi:uncharacterized protein YbjT (DUF2867 family)
LRVLLTGATGFIGSAVLARLASRGNEVVAVARPRRSHAQAAAARWVALDFAQATDPQHWRTHLVGVDAVVNCAGVFQDSPRDSTAGVHVHGPAALFAASEAAGVRRVIHVSALGVAPDAPTAFARSKFEGEKALIARDLDWVILRPGVVLGRAAYGGSALLRGLAALPVAFRLPDSRAVQIVQLEDVVSTIEFFLGPAAPTRVVVDLVGPERLTLDEIVSFYRRWLGCGEAPVLTLPSWLGSLMYRAGDLVAVLGWRPPLRTTARLEVARGSLGDPAPLMRMMGARPKSLAATLAREPASVQERWFAQLYFIKPLVLGALALFWVLTGIISLGPGWREAVRLLTVNGILEGNASLVLAGALADILVGAGIAWQRTCRPALQAALVLSLAYLGLATALLPRLWADPLGPLLKILPILVLNLVALAILDDR